MGCWWYSGLPKHTSSRPMSAHEPSDMMLHEALDAQRKMLPCSRHPAHGGGRGARLPWPPGTYPTVPAPAEAGQRKAKGTAVPGSWCPDAVAPLGTRPHPTDQKIVPRTSLFR